MQRDYMALWQASGVPEPHCPSPRQASGVPEPHCPAPRQASGVPEAPIVLLRAVLVAHHSEVGSWCPDVSK